MSRQGTTSDDIAATRVARSVLFFAVSIVFAVVLLLDPAYEIIPLRSALAIALLVYVITLLVATLCGIRAGNLFRIALLILMGWCYLLLVIFDFTNHRTQAATLLIYLAGNCWIEVWLGFRVRLRPSVQES